LDKKVKSIYPVAQWFEIKANFKAATPPFLWFCPCDDEVAGFKCVNGAYTENVNIANVYSHLEKRHNEPCDWSVVTELGNTLLVKTLVDDARGNGDATKSWSLAKFLARGKEKPSLPESFARHVFASMRAAALRVKENAEADRAAKRRRVEQTTLPQTVLNLAATKKRAELETRIAVFVSFVMADTPYNVAGNLGFQHLLEHMAGDTATHKPTRRQLAQLLPFAFEFVLRCIKFDVSQAKAVTFGNIVRFSLLKVA
jgi:hypothetical protein